MPTTNEHDDPLSPPDRAKSMEVQSERRQRALQRLRAQAGVAAMNGANIEDIIDAVRSVACPDYGKPRQ